MAGSYVSFVTAFLVVDFDSLLAWILPTLVASPLIARASARAVRSPANRGSGPVVRPTLPRSHW